MYVIEPRREFNELNQQKLVKKIYQLVENTGYVLSSEETVWSDEHIPIEQWYETPELEEGE